MFPLDSYYQLDNNYRAGTVLCKLGRMDFTAPLRLTTTRERIDLARRVHRAIIGKFAVLFVCLAGVILFAGLVLAPQATSTVGVLILAGAFLAVPVAVALWVLHVERRAELFLASDGITVVQADPRGVSVAETLIPYERITCLYGNVEFVVNLGSESTAQAPKGYGVIDAQKGPVWTRVGTGLHRRWYTHGAKSGIWLCIGVDKMGSLGEPNQIVRKVPLVPDAGDDTGRVLIPLGAYLGFGDLESLLRYVQHQTGGALFPLGIVDGAMDWASVQVGASDSREKIWADAQFD